MSNNEYEKQDGEQHKRNKYKKKSENGNVIAKCDKKYTEEEVEERVSDAVNDALNAEFLKVLKSDDNLKNHIIADTKFSITTFRTLGFLKGMLLSVLFYSGLLAIYNLTVNVSLFDPKGTILLFGFLFALIDKTIRPIVLFLEKKLPFKTSGIILILVYTIIIYYSSIQIQKEFNVNFMFNSFYELFYIVAVLLLMISLVDYLVLKYITRNMDSNLILGSEEND